MIKARDVKIDTRSLGTFLLTEVRPDVKDGTQIGFKYAIALPHHQLEKFNVKIAGKQQIDVDDQIDEVAFDNLVVRPYVIDGRFGITATATAIKKVNNQTK